MQEIANVQADAPVEEATSYISVDEMAKLLSIARITAYQLTKTEGFPSFHVGKRIIIPLRSLHRWAEEQASKQAALLAKGGE